MLKYIFLFFFCFCFFCEMGMWDSLEVHMNFEKVRNMHVSLSPFLSWASKTFFSTKLWTFYLLFIRKKYVIHEILWFRIFRGFTHMFQMAWPQFDYFWKRRVYVNRSNTVADLAGKLNGGIAQNFVLSHLDIN